VAFLFICSSTKQCGTIGEQMEALMKQKRVGILLFDDVEVLDFCGPYEVFTATRLNEARRRVEPSPFQVSMIAQKRSVVKASGGLRVVPDYVFQDCPSLHILVVPGGWGTRTEIENKDLIAWIAKVSDQVETLTSVCTGSMLLGRAGLLDGRRATTHWRALDWMRESFPGAVVEDDVHVLEDGDLVTSAGISAGIDMALRVVARYHGEQVARATARHMEYPFPENNRRRV
jgi:transcriptional regulator GlxA family with amidase domain